MNSMTVGALLLAIGTSAAPGDVIHRYSGTLSATVLEEVGDKWEVGDVLTGQFEYFSDSMDGAFQSHGNGGLTGNMLWSFPWNWPPGKDGIMVSEAQLTVANGQVSAFAFSVHTDLLDYSFYNGGFDLAEFVSSPGSDWPSAKGTLTYGVIRTADTGSTAFLLAGAMGVLAALRGCHRTR